MHLHIQDGPLSSRLYFSRVTADLILPQCLNLCLLSALLLGILYLFFGAFPLVFSNNHGFTLSQVGLTFLGLFVGMVFGISCDPLWRRYYQRLVVRNQGTSEPEFRLPSTVAGALIVPVGLFGGCIQMESNLHSWRNSCRKWVADFGIDIQDSHGLHFEV